MTLTANQRRYLARHICAWCDQRLDRSGCGAIYEKCGEDAREKRRMDCLKAYRPRSPR